jgi:GTP pyrophosphokinase
VKIVDGLTKISNVMDANTSQQAENFKKILLTLTDDPRVILIKLADRLHNMRTMDSMKREKQLKISSETVYVYAPLAHRMGLVQYKNGNGRSRHEIHGARHLPFHSPKTPGNQKGAQSLYK